MHAACRAFSEQGVPCASAQQRDSEMGLNRAGIMRVSVEQAFKLPLALGDGVYIVLKLMPWKEKARTATVPWGDVGAVWSSTRAQSYSLIHLYNSERTPLPVLRVEVWRSALKIMDEIVGVADIPLAPLIRRPFAEAERWHQLTAKVKEGTPGQSHSRSITPSAGAVGMVLLKVSFEPAAELTAPTPSGASRPPLLLDEVGGDESNAPPRVTEKEEQADPAVDDVHVHEKKVHEGQEGEESAGPKAGRQHLFGLTTFLRPTWCDVCSGMIYGVLSQGYRCECCGTTVHSGCQLRANFMGECGARGEGSIDDTRADEGVGLLHVTVASCHRCTSGCSAGTHDAEVVNEGDSYCRLRVGGSEGETYRTRTVFQTSSPSFDESWIVSVPGYDVPVDLELYDASREKLIGSYRTMPFELLQGVHDGDPSEVLEAELKDTRNRTVGLVRGTLAFREDLRGLFWSSTPREVSPRQPDDLSIESLMGYVKRLQGIVAGIASLYASYQYIMSWESFSVTLTAAALFLYLDLFASAEYALAMGPFLILAHMSAGLVGRKSGAYVARWVGAGASEKKFRPLAYLRVAPVRGKDLVSEELGLPGNAFVRIYYRPRGWTGPGGLFVGETAPSPDATPDPDWSKQGAWGRSVEAGADAASALLHNVVDLWPRREGGREDLSFLYPIVEQDGASGDAWSGDVLVHVLLANPFNAIMDTLIGEVTIPITSLTARDEVEGWYGIHGDDTDENENGSSEPGLQPQPQPQLQGRKSAVLLRMDLSRPQDGLVPTPDEIEISRAVQSMQQISSETAAARSGGSGASSTPSSSSTSSVSAIGQLRSSIQGIQTTLGSVLDTIEAVKNLLNWSHPPKTAFIYLVAIAAWVVLLLVPGRAIFLVLGLEQFTSKWRRTKKNPSKKSETAETREKKPPSPLLLKLRNLLLSVPTDKDLKRCYAARALEHTKVTEARFRLHQARDRVKSLGIGCLWQGEMVDISGNGGGGEGGDEKKKFVVVQGHRVAWWSGIDALRAGRGAEGALLLQGHAGVSQASPLEKRREKNPDLLICIFGLAPDGRPARKVFRAVDVAKRNEVEDVVRNSIGKDD